ncbi:YggU family protein [Candidatus Woesearchaeota archaeon]|nr:YggU family protein [Candidatus Woesearchaeota archaeon]
MTEILVHVKPGKKKNLILRKERGGEELFVEIKAPAKDGKANLELVKFLKKELGQQVRIKSGFSGKDKILLVGI